LVTFVIGIGGPGVGAGGSVGRGVVVGGGGPGVAVGWGIGVGRGVGVGGTGVGSVCPTWGSRMRREGGVGLTDAVALGPAGALGDGLAAGGAVGGGAVGGGAVGVGAVEVGLGLGAVQAASSAAAAPRPPSSSARRVGRPGFVVIRLPF
jgi:hypothetical protein